jgi:hypothetical protein
MEEVYVKALGASIKILILDDPSNNIRQGRAFNNILGSRDDAAFKVYSALLEEGNKVDTRSLVSLVNKSQYAINNSLTNLRQLELVDYDTERKGPYELKRWSPEKHILGLMRIIPETYFKKGYPPEMLKKDP